MTAPGSFLDEVIIYFRQYVKEGDSQSLPDDTCIDWINRFVVNKMPKRLQLWDYKRQFFIDLEKDVEHYYLPKDQYQNLLPPIYVDGIESGYYQSDAEFYRAYPEQVFNEQPLNGDGGTFYEYTLSDVPIKTSFYDKPLPNGALTTFNRYLIPNFIISAINENSDIEYYVDQGDGFLYRANNDLQPIDVNNNDGTIDYISGDIDITFSANIPTTNPITIQSIPYQANRPTGVLFTDNYIKTYPIPDKPYRLSFVAEITPAQFFKSTDVNPPDNDSQLLPFAYMGEYIALGAAMMFMWSMRKEEQIRFYTPYFKETENELLRRSSRQKDTQRTQTIFSAQTNSYTANYYNNWW